MHSYTQQQFSPEFKFGINFQAWARYAQLNPGSTIGKTETDQITDLSIRRARFITNIAITESLTFFSQIGINNVRANNGGSYPVNLLDFQVTYAPFDAFKLAIGKTGYKGISRYASPSTSTIMGLDILPLQVGQVNESDDLLRRLSVTALGKINKLNYRIVIADPNQNGATSAISTRSGYAPNTNERNYGAYFSVELKDKESHINPYMRGTYLGDKHVLNFGAGFEYQKNAMWFLNNQDTAYHNLFIAAADVFFEKQLSPEKNNVFTLYSAIYIIDQGPNFVRQIALNNPVSSGNVIPGQINGPGTTTPNMGTGEHLIVQTAYLLGKNQRVNGQFQINGAIQTGYIKAIPKPATTTWLGLQYFMHGHASKLSFSWINRPLMYTNDQPTKRLSEFIVQYQLKFNQ